jgi:hypothetical protein
MGDFERRRWTFRVLGLGGGREVDVVDGKEEERAKERRKDFTVRSVESWSIT